MERTLRETIKETMRQHLSKGYLAFGQCLTAVGWVNGTIPELTEADGLIELPMSDVMDSAIAVGAAIMGKRPMFIIRYQGFNWFNSIFFTNYAAKSRELWGQPVPVFIRSLAMEGGVGPVAGSSHHGIYYRMPGVKIVAPMSPGEYIEIYENFMQGDDPMYVSEHRKSFDTSAEYENQICKDDPDFVLFPFSITRLEMEKLKQLTDEQGIKIDIYHQHWIKPLKITETQIGRLARSKLGGFVFDDDYPNGIAKQIAYELMLKSARPVHAMGLEEKVAGACPEKDNLPPSAAYIAKTIGQIYEHYKNKI
jgi:acetoin:2,6-dichlorophenolindophenol oxidoreductase subunit beta